MHVLSKIKSILEDMAFVHRLITRKVYYRTNSYRVFSWHPMPWQLPDIPPLSWLADRVAPGDVVFDVGSNRGYLSLGIAASVSNVKIVAFEPNPIVKRKLLANIELNSELITDIRVMDLALGDSKGYVDFYVSESDTASSFNKIHAEEKGTGVTSVVKVEISTLDELISEGVVPIPDHIKIDTEGYEVPILLGAKKIIEKRRPSIYAEIHGKNDDVNNENDIRSFLSSYDYNIVKFQNQLMCTRIDKGCGFNK